MMHLPALFITVVVAVSGVLYSSDVHAQRAGADEPERSQEHWYAGTWDSTLYAWSDPIHPHTVGVRIEVVDSRTLLPVEDAYVQLKGTYAEEHLGRIDDPSTPRIQQREYELSAQTDHDGIVVFALSWQKEYPWSQERPLVRDQNMVGDAKTHARSWIRPVDDIEKVGSLEIRHSKYTGSNTPLGFNRLINFGQDISTESQVLELFELFEAAWRSEITEPGVKFCVLHFGDEYDGYSKRYSSAPEFFEHIRRKNYGNVYDTPPNLSGLSKDEFAGPYLIYEHQVTIDPARIEIDISE